MSKNCMSELPVVKNIENKHDRNHPGRLQSDWWPESIEADRLLGYKCWDGLNIIAGLRAVGLLITSIIESVYRWKIISKMWPGLHMGNPLKIIARVTKYSFISVKPQPGTSHTENLREIISLSRECYLLHLTDPHHGIPSVSWTPFGNISICDTRCWEVQSEDIQGQSRLGRSHSGGG